MSLRRPLVEDLTRLIGRTYGVPHPDSIGRFIVGDEGHRRLLQDHEVDEVVAHDGSGARLLLRRASRGRVRGAWAAALYLPNAMIEHLEREDPRRTVHAGNVDAFATLVEEIDHFVTFFERVCVAGRDVSLLELEWHAAITKYLTLSHFVSRLQRRPAIDDEGRAFVEHHLFHKVRYVDDDESIRERYRMAQRLGMRFVRDLGRRTPRERLAHLRRFHRADHHTKLREFRAA